MQDAFGHCAALVRRADKDRYLATLFAPAPLRGPLFALYAFNTEVAQVRDRAREPMPGEIRLQWWRDVLAGERRDEADANPVAAALLATTSQFELPLRAFEELLEAHAFDLYDDPMGTMAELEGYCVNTSSAAMALAGRILADGADPGGTALTDHLGIAHGIAAILSALGLHASRRQLYLPLDLLSRHGARAEDVFAARATPELTAALADVRAHARSYLTQAGRVSPSMPPAWAPALLPAALSGEMLERMERRGYDPFAPAPLPPWRRQWLIWRAARNPARIFR